MRGNKCRLDAVKAGSGSSGLSRGMPSMSMLFPGVSVRVFLERLSEVVRHVLNVLRGTTPGIGSHHEQKGWGKKKKAS